ncbi:MAG: sugar phosphate nucleotidyltransferase, partial [Myxococcota bacterium]
MNEAPAVVLLAGGRGARFWPRSRRSHPKQCLSLQGSGSLIQQAFRRAEMLTAPERILVITGPDMRSAIAAQLPSLPAENLIVEPQPRNTAPAMGLAAALVVRRFGTACVLCALPADHLVDHPQRLTASLRRAVHLAADHPRAIVTVGIQPSRPETGYGYIELGQALDEDHDAFAVQQFKEKPDRQTAQGYIDAGRFLWNAGMFIAHAGGLLQNFAAHLPRTATALHAIVADPRQLDGVWGQTDATSFDYGILERAQTLLVVQSDPGWSDVGSWDRAAELLAQVGDNRTDAKTLIAINARNNAVSVSGTGRAVALVGVEDLIVVDTEDALLILRRGS